MAGFEQQLTQLETVVERLERGELSLDESVRLFEEGMKLSQACRQELEQAEGRIQVLVEDTGGKMQPADLEVGDEEDDDDEQQDDEEQDDDVVIENGEDDRRVESSAAMRKDGKRTDWVRG